MRYIIILLFLLTPILSKQVSRTQIIMGTTATITVDEVKKVYIQYGFDILRDVERSLSSYDKSAKVHQLNQNKIVLADNYLLDILKKSKKYYHLTDGYFDVTIGSITKDLYRFGEDEKIVSKKELLNAKVDVKSILIHGKTISLKKGIKIDFGGIGKGYGVDVVSKLFNDLNISNAKIALSGDMRCFDICKFSIKDPFNTDKTLLTFNSKIKNLSISTSGTYERYIKNKMHHHLINPKTKQQGRAFVSATIFTNSNNTKADAIATAVSVMPKDKAIDFLLGLDVGFVLVEPDGKVISAYLKKFVKHIK